MFFNLTQDFDSLPKKKISFNCLESSKVKEQVKDIEKQQKILEIPVNVFSSAAKRPLQIKTGPNKRIKFSTKPDYDFLDTQQQITPFQKPRKSIPAGPLCSKFSNFLSSNPKTSIPGFILDSKTEFGCKVLTIDFGHTSIPGIQGPMTVLYFSSLSPSGQVSIFCPILIQTPTSTYVLCKEIV